MPPALVSLCPGGLHGRPLRGAALWPLCRCPLLSTLFLSQGSAPGGISLSILRAAEPGGGVPAAPTCPSFSPASYAMLSFSMFAQHQKDGVSLIWFDPGGEPVRADTGRPQPPLVPSPPPPRPREPQTSQSPAGLLCPLPALPRCRDLHSHFVQAPVRCFLVGAQGTLLPSTLYFLHHCPRPSCGVSAPFARGLCPAPGRDLLRQGFRLPRAWNLEGCLVLSCSSRKLCRIMEG